MSRFDSYFFMQKEEDVIEYVKEKLDFFEKDAVLTCKEIGDGNINYVYRVMDELSLIHIYAVPGRSCHLSRGVCQKRV